jgi:DNA-binding SARP family transcriptional activator/tetratricopeptide (TPR) repeat protein
VVGRFAVDLLGGFQIALHSGGVCALPTRKAQALLAYLALPPGRAYHRDTLAALLWGERPDTQARKSLRQTVYALRKALRDAGDALVLDGERIALNPATVESDASRFERLVRDGTTEALEQAAALYRGDLLHGFRLDEPGFEEWLVAERERLRELAIEGLGKLLAHQATATATERGIQTAVRLLALDPLQESGHRALMRFYARQGRRTAALRQYQTCVELLRREVRTEPEAQTTWLYQEVLRQGRDARGGPEVGPAPSVPPTAAPGAGGRLGLPARGIPLIGRDAELGRLRDLAQLAEEGRGQVAIVLGEAGIGKTRLLAEIAGEALARKSEVLLGRAFESEQLLAFGPWVAAIRSGRVLEGPSVLDTLAPVWRRELARLFPEAGEPVAGQPGEENYRRLFEAIERLLSAATQRRPVMLLLEDLHWADEMSLRLLSYLGRRNHAWKLLVIASARTEELVGAAVLRRAIDELLQDERCIERTLLPLTHRDTVELVRVLTRSHGRTTSSGLEEQIWRASEGNPFVAVEIVRALEQGTEDSQRIALPLTLPPPERVRKLITGRLDRLSAQGQHVAAVAAAIGREFEFGLLQRAAGLSDREAAAAVEELVRRRVIHGAAIRFDFTHDLIREVAYLRLLPSSRQVLHKQVVDALEALSAGDEQVERLGHHALRAGLWAKALGYLGRAGSKAMTRSAYREAAVLLEQALGTVSHLEQTAELLARVVDLRLSLRTAMVATGRPAESVAHLREAERLAEGLGDRQRLGRVFTLSTNSHYLLGQYDEAMAAARRALSIAAELHDAKLEATANLFIGQIYYQQGNLAAAAALVRQVLDYGVPGQALGVAGLTVAARLILCWCLAKLGRFDDSLIAAHEAVSVARERSRPSSLVAAHLGLIIPYLYKGDVPEAIAVGEQAVALCEKIEAPVLLPMIQSQLGHAYMLADRGAEALPLSEAGERGFVAHGVMAGYSIMLRFLAETYCTLGRIDDAMRAAMQAYEVASRYREVDHEAEASRVLGDVTVLASPTVPDAAERHYRTGLALATPRGARPLTAHCHLGLGRLLVRTGRREDSRQHLATAITMYREMAMQLWLRKAEAAWEAGRLD